MLFVDINFLIDVANRLSANRVNSRLANTWEKTTFIVRSCSVKCNIFLTLWTTYDSCS